MDNLNHIQFIANMNYISFGMILIGHFISQEFDIRDFFEQHAIPSFQFFWNVVAGHRMRPNHL